MRIGIKSFGVVGYEPENICNVGVTHSNESSSTFTLLTLPRTFWIT